MVTELRCIIYAVSFKEAGFSQRFSQSSSKSFVNFNLLKWLTEEEVDAFLLERLDADGGDYLRELDSSISDHIPLAKIFKDDSF